MLKDLLRRAQDAAQRHLPESVRDTGRRLVDAVLEHAPQSVQDRVAPLLRADPGQADPPGPGEAAPASTTSPTSAGSGETTGEGELDFRDTQKRVVLFGYPEDPATNRVAALFAAEGITFRRQNLHLQPREALQIASMTGVMVAPYVFIHGRFWGGEGEMESLCALKQLGLVIDNRLDALSREARRIGKLKESFDDALTVANITDRLHRGHILRVDDLDCWCEPARAGQPARFFYDGAPRAVEHIPDVAAEIVRRAEVDGAATLWVVDPT
jgi:glutaredoxin